MIIFLTKKIRYVLKGLAFFLIFLIAIQSMKWVVKIAYPIHYRYLIEKHAATYDIDPYLVTAIIRNESKFNPYAVSPKDAKGLMQIAPITGVWASEKLNIENYSEDRLFEPDLNIQIGCWYLNVLDKEFDGELQLMIAAYNAGNGNVKRWLQDYRYSRDGRHLDEIPFGETRIYLKKVLRDYEIYKKLYQ